MALPSTAAAVLPRAVSIADLQIPSRILYVRYREGFPG
jgi:hypothetical protein